MLCTVDGTLDAMTRTTCAFQNAAFFRRSHAVSVITGGQRRRPEVSRGTGCGRFYRKLAEKLVPVRNNAHTRAVTRAGTIRR